MPAVVYAVANQKGGVAKTTTALALAAAWAERDIAVLVVDLDPQASLSYSLGEEPDALEASVHDVLTGRTPMAKVIRSHPETDLAPASIDLAGAEVVLLTRTGREYVLRAALDDLRDTYDLIVVDCPPSLGVLTLNALTAADRLVVPVQCETLSHRGVAQLLEVVHDVQRMTNRDLEVAGWVATMYDGRTRHAREVLADVGKRYGLPLLGVPVRRSVRFSEAPRSGRSILSVAGSIQGSAAYRVIAAELAGLEVDPAVRARAQA